MLRSSESSEKDVVSDSPGSEWICSKVLTRLLDIKTLPPLPEAAIGREDERKRSDF